MIGQRRRPAARSALRPGSPAPRRTGFGTRLLLAQTIVVLGGAAGAAVVALVVAPHLFHTHLRHAGLDAASPQANHVEEAFASSLIVSMAVALLSSVCLALAVSWFLTRRVQRSISSVVSSASHIGAGNYRVRVSPSSLGREFSELAGTVNQLAERLETVEEIRQQMLSDLAHELRTPVTTINAHIEALEDGIREPGQPTYDVIRSSTARLQRLAEDIDAVSRAGERQLRIALRPTTTAELITAATREAHDSYRAAQVQLVIGTMTGHPLDVDPERIGQALANLLNNARRHTPAGGTVIISSRVQGRNFIEISVEDAGDGIAPEYLPHVFDRFYRTDTSRSRDAGGSGIGLTIARALIQAHGGTLTATSDGIGSGATFTLTLPRVSLAAQWSHRWRPAPHPAPARTDTTTPQIPISEGQKR